jgi:hypothetical protein
MRGSYLAKVFFLLVLGLCFVMPGAQAQSDGGQGLKVLKADDSAFPKIRLYLEVPDSSWAGGKATLEFEHRDGDYDRIKAAIIEARKKNEAGGSGEEGADASSGGADVPDLPSHAASGEAIPFLEQEDPKEDLLVVFLLDHSGSMMNKPGKEKKDRHQLAIDMVTKIIKRGIRLRDNVVLVLFAEEIQPIFGPSSDHADALKALNEKYVRVDKSGSKKTYIFNSLDFALSKFVSMKEVHQPTLPHRRIVVVLSDGKDEGMRTGVSLKPDVVANKWKIHTNEGVLVTVGLGSKGAARDKVYKDLAHIASLADRPENHSREGTVKDAFETFGGATKKLRRQVMIEFEVPRYHWKKGEQDVVVTLSAPGGEGGAKAKTQNVPHKLQLGAIKPEQVKNGEAYRKELSDFADQWAKDTKADVTVEEEKKAWKLYGIIGGSVLFLLILFGIIASKKRQARNRERLARLDALETGMVQQMADQEKKILDQMEAQKTASTKEAKLAAVAAAEASRTVLATLVGADGPLKGHSFPIKDPRCLVGRDDEHCHLSFPNEGGDLSISRVHAELSMQGGGWVVVCMSNGGMHVNQSSLRKDEQYPLQFGDLLKMGKSVFRFSPP